MAGWNGSSGGSTATPKKPVKAKPLALGKGALAGILVVTVAIVFMVVLSGKRQADDDDSYTRRRSIAENKASKSIAIPDRSAESSRSAEATSRSSAQPPLTTGDEGGVQQLTNNVYVVPAATNRIFKTGLEQVLNMIFNTEVGNFPGPLPHIHANEEDNLAGILISVNKILESDDDRVRAKKEQVDFAKKELIKFIKEGGSYQEFLRYYHGELVKAFRERKECQRAIDEFGEQEGVDASMVREFHKKVNANLAEKGIKLIELPDEYQDENESTETQEY